ncbi:TRAP transporter small permease subunit [Frigidibacter oleivorans]|uniref:TRAP transporter small permease subunit n=1 Tax=Frigidibacter oleivorans TaxID=2487129 RepID=UPI000F8D8A36|nr:TRAP transporter small permease [Frigidibacter oleivorans]
MSSAPARPSPAPAGAFGRAADRIMGLANIVATSWILLIMALILADVAGRNLLGRPVAGVPEMVKFSIVGIVFLQIAHTHRRGEMIRSDGILGMLAARRPGLARAMDIGAQLAGAAFALMLAWAIWPKALRAFRRGEMEGVSGHFQLPVWPFHTLILLGSLLLALSFLLAAAERARLPHPER